MKSSLIRSFTLAAALVVTTPVFAADPVVAIVGSKKFTYSEVMKTKSSLPKQYQSAPDDKIFPVLLNQAVDTYLINQAAQASKVADTPEVKNAIAKATEELISQAYLMEQIKPKITDAAVKAKFEEVIKNFPKEKEVHLRHILVDSKGTAMAVIKALKAGTDFKKLAQQKSTDATAKEGGDLGFIRKSELPKELADAAFALAAGGYSKEPVKTDFGWHVLKVEEFRDAKPPTLDEVQNELKTLMTQEAILVLLKGLREKAKVELFDKDGKPLPAPSEKKADAKPESATKSDAKGAAAPAKAK